MFISPDGDDFFPENELIIGSTQDEFSRDLKSALELSGIIMDAIVALGYHLDSGEPTIRILAAVKLQIIGETAINYAKVNASKDFP